MSNGIQRELDFTAPAVVNVWQRRALAVGVVFGIASIIGWIQEYDQFYRSYLLGYMWCFELTVGSLALLMLYHLTGGAWGTVIRRILEAATRNIWLMLVLFAPIIIGVHRLYPWSRPDVLAESEHLQKIASQYLRLGLWLPRAALYFLVWISLVWILDRISRRQDRDPQFQPDRLLRQISGPGEVVYMLMTLFLYTDWLMSLDPEWHSMIYALIFNSGHGLAAISFSVVIAALLVRHEPMKDVIKPDQFLDHGKIMLTFVMIWGWWTYAQWIIYWSGNKPDEIGWYLARTRGGWEVFGLVWIVGYFCVPFALLLSRSFKSNSQHLMKLAMWTLLARYLDLYWFIMPEFPNRAGNFHYSWLDAVVPISLGAFWLALFFQHLKTRPLLAVHDAHVRIILEEGYAHER
ncbi:MAG: hypothetical protein ACE14M_09065 [Terriglobales bacterium]